MKKMKKNEVFFFQFSIDFKKKASLHFGIFFGGGGGYQTSASGTEPQCILKRVAIEWDKGLDMCN